MKKIIAIGASNSKNSINKRLATYVANQVENAEVKVVDLNEYGLPLFGVDFQNENGIPENVHKVNELLESADGIVISLAEHNGTYTVAFKNLFDWLSRIDNAVWKNKPMLLMASSPGGRGGQKILAIAKEAFPWFGGNVVADFSLPMFNDFFSEEGLKDEAKAVELKEKIQLLEDAMNDVAMAV